MLHLMRCCTEAIFFCYDLSERDRDETLSHQVLGFDPDQSLVSRTAYIDRAIGRGASMISLSDCIAMCGLNEDEVLAIAEHEHIPEIAAAALGQYLLNQQHGPETIRDMIRADIRSALARNDRTHARDLVMALRHFLSEHPRPAL